MPKPIAAGAYVLGELLGRGGMGSVYVARQPSIDRMVAVKLLHPELANDVRVLDRFRSEILAGSRLSHPNAASVIDFGATAEGIPFLVMAYVAGECVSHLIEREGALGATRACALVLQLLAALEAAHLAGVIHADVKCDNLLVSHPPDGSELLTLIDFGIARLGDRPYDGDGQLVSGTPEYLAPEVIRGAPPTAASDIYAAGIVLYELLTGASPFHGGTTAEIIARQLDEDVVAPSLRCPDMQIPPALDRVVLKAVAKEPADRHASAAAFAAALAASIPTRATTSPTVEHKRANGFAAEAPTQDWPLQPRRRTALGTLPQRQPDHHDQLRAAIGAAIASGSTDAIASTYLDLARSLVAEHHLARAAAELEEAVDILTLGQGPKTKLPPASLWRVLLALAAIYDGIGDPARARSATRHAAVAAGHAKSAIGRDRAHSLLRRLVYGVSA